MANKKLKKLLRITTWILSGAGLLVLLIAAMKKRDQQICSAIEIEVQGASQTLFIDRNDIINMLTANGGRKIKGQQIGALNLKQLEAALGKNVWLEKADLYFDKNATLQIRVRENIPVGRIFSTSGNSWYIDSAGNKLPLSDKFSARLPVFTGFPSDKRNLSKEDSILLQRIKGIAGFLQANPFWLAQVTEISITPDKQFEIYPLVGSHIIELGDGLDLNKRFERLDLFYKQVMQQTGPNAWSRLKIQYDKQVIGVRTKKG